MGNDERRKSERQTKPTKRSRGLNYDESESDIALYLSEFNEFANEIQNDPLNIHEALSRNDKLEWIKAMNEEIQSLKSRNTWEYAYPPKDANVIGTRFVYKIKRLANESIEKYKAHLVVQGYAQKDKIDFYSNDLFASVTRITIVRLLLS